MGLGDRGGRDLAVGVGDDDEVAADDRQAAVARARRARTGCRGDHGLGAEASRACLRAASRGGRRHQLACRRGRPAVCGSWAACVVVWRGGGWPPWRPGCRRGLPTATGRERRAAVLAMIRLARRPSDESSHSTLLVPGSVESPPRKGNRGFRSCPDMTQTSMGGLPPETGSRANSFAERPARSTDCPCGTVHCTKVQVWRAVRPAGSTGPMGALRGVRTYVHPGASPAPARAEACG